MRDPVSIALAELAVFAVTCESNDAMVAEVRKVQALHAEVWSAWREMQATRKAVCDLLKINPGELVP